MNKPDAILQREQFIESVLLSKESKTVELEWLRKAVIASLGIKNDISLFTIISYLRRIRERGIPGHKLHFGSTTAVLERVQVTTLDDRKQKHAAIKQRIGILLWESVLGIDVHGKQQNVTANLGGKHLIERKIAAVQKKTNLSILVDAGSSTCFAIEALLKTKSVPIRVNTAPSLSTQLIRPSLITNSLAIAEAVSQSSHFAEIPVRIIGGDLRVDRGSVCGPLTDMCLENWSQRADLAVISTTGYREEFSGSLAFGCDDISEACLKCKMLEMAWFRILVFDSSKLIIPEVSNIFAALSNELIDLVVTDDGEQIGAADAVNQFRHDADAAGVATFVLKTAKNNSKDKNVND